MKVLLEIEDSKGKFVMELLKNLKFVKAKPLTAHSADIVLGLKEAVEEMKQIKAGKLSSKSAKELLNEL